MRIVAATLVLLTLAAPAGAQSTRYGPPPSDDRLRQFSDELSKLVDEAEKARAADYRFLRDVRDLMRRYANPWRVQLLFDDFRDGDFTANPAWTVRAGAFEVAWRDGLRSRIEPAAQQPAQQNGQQSGKNDAAKALLGILLQQALKDKSQPQQQPAPAPRDSYAQIATAQRISNAFAIRLDLRSFAAAGRIAFGPYQGAAMTAGYSLAYNPGATPSLELLLATSRGTSLLQSVREPLGLEDGKGHLIEWTRDSDGAMAVSVDGRPLMQVVDRSLRDPFDGFTIVNFGGDFAVREVSVSGTGQP